MSDKEKLDILCKELKDKIKNIQTESEIQKRWNNLALQGSIQTRNKLKR